MFDLIFRYRILEIFQIAFVGLFGLAASVSSLKDLNVANSVIFATALFLHIAGAYYFNDFYDRAADSQNPRKPKTGGNGKKLLIFAWFCTGISVLLSVLVSQAHLLMFLLLNLIAYTYSCPPFRLKARIPFPMLLHFVMGAIYFSAGYSVSSANWDLATVAIMVFWGLVLASGSIINEAVDMAPDQAAGIQTLAMKLSPTGLRRLMYALHVPALFLISWYTFGKHFVWAFGVSIFSISFYHFAFFYLATSNDYFRFRKLCRATFIAATMFAFFEHVSL